MTTVEKTIAEKLQCQYKSNCLLAKNGIIRPGFPEHVPDLGFDLDTFLWKDTPEGLEFWIDISGRV